MKLSDKCIDLSNILEVPPDKLYFKVSKSDTIGHSEMFGLCRFDP